MKDKQKIAATIERVYREMLPKLGKEATDEMAMPAYLRGNTLSRYVFWKKLDVILAAAKLKSGASVFDFGCGTGILLSALSDDNRQVIATDLHPEPAARLVDLLGLQRIKFAALANWEKEIQPHSVDVIIAANVLEHVEDRPALLKTFAQKLRKGGRLVVSGPTENSMYRLGRRIIRFSGDYHVTTIFDIMKEIDALGYSTVFNRSWPFVGPGCLYQIAAFTPPAAN